MAGLQCLKYLWYLVNDPSKIPESSEADKFVMSQGYEVQKYAEILLNGESEKAFSVDGLYARADIIANNCVYEVKASNSSKPEHIEDISFQRYVYRKAGQNFDKYFIVYLNKEYTRKGISYGCGCCSYFSSSRWLAAPIRLRLRRRLNMNRAAVT